MAEKLGYMTEECVYMPEEHGYMMQWYDGQYIGSFFPLRRNKESLRKTGKLLLSRTNLSMEPCSWWKLLIMSTLLSALLLEFLNCSHWLNKAQHISDLTSMKNLKISFYCGKLWVIIGAKTIMVRFIFKLTEIISTWVGTTPRGSEMEHASTWLLSWSTLPPRPSSWLTMLLGTTGRVSTLPPSACNT